MVLEKLDEIQWDQLEKPYGRPATDVPEHIRGLLSPDQAVRDRSMDKLYWSLNYDYCLGTVTPVAIPFLIELLEHDDTPDKHNILIILIECFLRSEPPPQKKQHRITPIEVETGQQITKGLEVYIRHLNHPEWRTRRAAIRLLVEGPFPRSLRQRRKAIYEHYKTQEQHPESPQFFERLDQWIYEDSSLSEVSDDAPPSSTTQGEND